MTPPYDLSGWAAKKSAAIKEAKRMSDIDLRVDHPIPNMTLVYIGHLTFAFSYRTIVGVHAGLGWKVSENIWSQTTGKHLNWLQPDKKARMPHAEFEKHLERMTRQIKLETIYG